MLVSIGRTLLALIFIVSGVRKVLGFGAVSAMMGAKGFPVPDVFLALTILLEIVGGIMLIANYQVRPVAWALAAFTMVAGSLFHAFWTHWGAPPPQFNNELNHFLKNVAIVGGLLLVAAQSTNAAQR